MKRVMCVAFPNWPIQRRLAGRPSGKGPALIVYSPPTRGKMRVTACCRRAREHGVHPGMVLVEAQALWPTNSRLVRFEMHDPSADRQALRTLTGWAQQFSPTVIIEDAEAPDCL